MRFQGGFSMRPSPKLLVLWFVLSCALAACNGPSQLASSGGSAIPGVPAAATLTRAPHNILIDVNPGILVVAIEASGSAVVEEHGYRRVFTITSDDPHESCKGIATWNPPYGYGPKFTLTVNGLKNGRCAIVLTDDLGRHSELLVSVKAPDLPVFVTDFLKHTVKEIAPGCEAASCVSTLGGGFQGPQAIAVDKAGNVFVADILSDDVKQIPPNCAAASCVTRLGGGFLHPTGVAVDASGNVFVSDFNNEFAVKKIPPGCASAGCVRFVGGGFATPGGLAVDAAGNVFVAEFYVSTVREIPAGCASAGCVLKLGGGFSTPGGVAVDASGDVFVADNGNNAVKKIPPGCVTASCVTRLGGGFVSPSSVAVDKHEHIFVGEAFSNDVKEVPPGCNSADCVGTLGGGLKGSSGIAISPVYKR
jgi:streptogramin lyase